MAKQFGTFNFNIAQLGVETEGANGFTSPAAATDVWVGAFGGVDDERERKRFEYQSGTAVPIAIEYDSALAAVWSMPDTELTYEQIIHLGDCGLVTVPGTGAGPYLWDYEISNSTSARATKARTLEIGNVVANRDVVQMPGAVPSEIKLSGKRGEAWMVGATWRGQRLIRNGTGSFTGFTPAIAAPTVVPVLFSDTKFYLDNSGGTVGTSQVLATLMNFEMTIDTGVRYLPPGDGNRYPTYIKRGAPSVTFTAGLELWQDGAVNIVAQERDAFNASAFRLIRLKTPGPEGRDLEIDMAARWSKVGAYGVEDEINTVVPFEGYASYSTADDLFFRLGVTNLLDAML